MATRWLPSGAETGSWAGASEGGKNPVAHTRTRGSQCSILLIRARPSQHTSLSYHPLSLPENLPGRFHRHVPKLARRCLAAVPLRGGGDVPGSSMVHNAIKNLPKYVDALLTAVGASTAIWAVRLCAHM